MKKIGFIGAYDKTDFILYIAKFITTMGKSVLFIDTTITQKAKYVVPVINPTTTYFTEYENIDVAVGFKKIEEIKEYLGLEKNEEINYDYIFIDVDSPEIFNNFKMSEANLNYFVTSFDLYSLKKGLEILSGLEVTTKMKKVLFSKEINKDDDEYLNFLSLKYKIEWDKEKIYFPFEQGDQSVIIENQRVAKIKIRNLSNQYKESLLIMVSQISENQDYGELKKIMRNIEKGV